MKIGVIADTHIPDIIPELPPKVKEIFRGVDIILHAGDITTVETLRELQNYFTITMAVAGEHDNEDAKKYLQTKQVVEFGNRKIGIIHGYSADKGTDPLSNLSRKLKKLFRPPTHEDLYQYVLSQFEDVDCIVFGYTHQPYVKVRNGVLLFNPGAVAPTRGVRASVGLLDIGKRAITGKIIYL